MRVLATLLLMSLLAAPLAAAENEWGERNDADGWPIAADGTSTNPFPGVPADVVAAALSGQGPPLNEVAGATIFPYWPLLKLEVERLAADHPDLVKLHSIGTSTLGLDLFLLEIANFDDIEAGSGIPLEAREVVFVDGGHHSNEYSGVYFTTHLAQFLLDKYEANETANWIVQNRHTWILPMVNPDGSNVMGRLNANLVNINRNYPVVWGQTTGTLGGDPTDAILNNAGPSPASEVETQLLLGLFNETRPDYYASIHCCGNLWLYPYGIEGRDPIDKAMFERVCDEAFAEVRDQCGPIWSTIYPAAGSSVDSAYEYAGSVGFGYEMSGRGAISLWGQPITTESVEVQEVESWNGVLNAMLNVHRFGAHPFLSAAAVGDGARITITNDGYGNTTNGTVTVNDQVYDLPVIPAGGNVTLAVGKDEVLADAAITVDYQKRAEATSAWGQTSTNLRLSIDHADHESPVAPLMVLAALVVAVALVLRRKA